MKTKFPPGPIRPSLDCAALVFNQSSDSVVFCQDLPADGGRVTAASFPPQLMAVTVMRHRQVTGVDWQVGPVALVWGECG